MRFLPIVAMAAASAACLPDLPSDGYERGPSDDAPRPRPMTSTGASSSPEPLFGETTRHHPAPPPLSGGTLASVPGKPWIVAADPDRDTLFVVDVSSEVVLATVRLDDGDEPGRVVVDSSLRAHVALRSGAALATIDLAGGNTVTKRPVCALPRGVAWDAATDDVHVACAGGELVTLAASGGAPKRRVFVARDLRDVVVTAGGLVVSTFRDADVMLLNADGTVQSQSPKSRELGMRVAWRMIALDMDVSTRDPAQYVLMAAQRTPGDLDPPPLAPPSYYVTEAPCVAPSGPVTVVDDGGYGVTVPNAVLPVDIARGKGRVLVVSAANAHLPGAAQIVDVPPETTASPYKPCGSAPTIEITTAEITSVVFEPLSETFWALSREPAQLIALDAVRHVATRRIALSSDTRRDTGHAIFHASSGRGAVACASCHPEGRDDGHAWRSLAEGPRRTPSLLGTLEGTAPYHWTGEARGLGDVMTMTFTQRMGGPALEADQKEAIGSWLRELPPLRRAPLPTAYSSATAVARGRRIFDGPSARCASCHSGARLTDNATIDVGTGGAMQVPSLVGVVHRAPYLHDGSRPHLRAVLQRPHGGAIVRDDEIDDLAVYLESL